MAGAGVLGDAGARVVGDGPSHYHAETHVGGHEKKGTLHEKLRNESKTTRFGGRVVPGAPRP